MAKKSNKKSSIIEPMSDILDAQKIHNDNIRQLAFDYALGIVNNYNEHIGGPNAYKPQETLDLTFKHAREIVVFIQDKF